MTLYARRTIEFSDETSAPAEWDLPDENFILKACRERVLSFEGLVIEALAFPCERDTAGYLPKRTYDNVVDYTKFFRVITKGGKKVVVAGKYVVKNGEEVDLLSAEVGIKGRYGEDREAFLDAFVGLATEEINGLYGLLGKGQGLFDYEKICDIIR